MDAKSTWVPTNEELQALSSRSHVDNYQKVDEIWPMLALNHGDVIAAKSPHSYPPETYSYQELSLGISKAASALKKLGINSGDVVALFSENSPRWLIVDQGIMRVGAIDAVRGVSAPVDELNYIVDDSKAIALVVQNEELYKKLISSPEDSKRFRVVIQLEGEADDDAISWEQFMSIGEEYSQNISKSETSSKSSIDTVATILYTSGTTGRPKGVPLSHRNLLHQIKALACVANPRPGDAVLSVLPIWHSYERSAEYFFFSCACTQNYTTIKKFKYDLPIVQPVVMATVPRLWEAIREGFYEAIKKMSPLKQFLIKSALLNSGDYKYALRKSRGKLTTEVYPIEKIIALIEVAIRFPIHRISASVFWPKVLNQICGGKLLFPISGGGAIAPHVDRFFESVGVELLVGYGLTETSPVLTCRRPWKNIRKSSGSPLPETQIQIVDIQTGQLKQFNECGLVKVKGPQVMSGYWCNEEATKKVIDSEGWFNTGDLGKLLTDGTLVLTGRSKDTIVLSNGENIEPGPLEEALLASSLIEQALLVGQDKRQLGLLMVPKLTEVHNWAEINGLKLDEQLGGCPGDHKLRKLLRQEVNKILQARSGSRAEERVIGVALVKPFTIENKLLTQTLKQRRDKISERDSKMISSIYES